MPAAVRNALPTRTLYLLRDPRDVYLRLFNAFNLRLWSLGIGRGPDDTDLDLARHLAYCCLVYNENLHLADRDRPDRAGCAVRGPDH